MRIHKLEAMSKGWFVGDFVPTAFRTAAFEVAIKQYDAGAREDRHHHKIAVELTAVIHGRVRMFDQEFGPGDIIQIDPGEGTGFEALTDTLTVVVKMPSVAGDKYLD